MGILSKLFGTSKQDAPKQEAVNAGTVKGKDTAMTTANSTQITKALELINTFASSDAQKAAGLLAEGYIQHNLAYGTGRDAFVSSVQYLASAPAPTTVRNIRAFEDGDKVFLHTVYNFADAGEQVAFDIFRFDEDGLICEHWDNLASIAEPNPSGRTQIDSQIEARDLNRTEANREVVSRCCAPRSR